MEKKIFIKRCPFCGFRPKITDLNFCYPLSKDKHVWRAGCVTDISGCTAEVLGSSQEEAIAKWNQRKDSLL